MGNSSELCLVSEQCMASGMCLITNTRVPSGDRVLSQKTQAILVLEDCISICHVHSFDDNSTDRNLLTRHACLQQASQRLCSCSRESHHLYGHLDPPPGDI
ncbi:hypothetical protein IG631_23617 [Alternaria alternata]|nr:hypothetical protein IG631_23617 [Alternaria alternata]